MKIIMELVEMIDDELSGAKEYVKHAMQRREEHPHLADTFADLAEQEMGHVSKLHDEVTQLIKEVRQRDGEPPAGMMEVYEYEHGKQIKKAAKVNQMISDYHNSR